MEKSIKTPFRIEKEKHDEKVYNDFISLMQKPGAMKSAVYKTLMARHHIHSSATIWSIIKRVEKRKSQKH